MPNKKAMRQEKRRERARADWIADRDPAIVATSRQLEFDERERIWRGLLDRGVVPWASSSYEWDYEPPRRRRPAPASLSFPEAVLDPDEEGNIWEPVRLALVAGGVSRIYELHHGENEDYSHELDAEGIEVTGWWERTWTDDAFEWAIQIDRGEEAVLVAGDRLLLDLKEVWPAWTRWHYQ